jgi:hypothetical protein
MKKLALLIFLAFLSKAIYSQNQISFDKVLPNNLIGFYTNLGVVDPFSFQKKSVDDFFHGKESLSIGFKYQRSLSKKLKLDLSLRYSKYKIVTEGPENIPPYPGPFTELFETITIPVTIKMYFPKEYFLSFGPLIDFNITKETDSFFKDPQSGFGLSFGVGKEFLISKFTFDISPNLEIHSLLPFNSTDHQRLLFGGLKIGLNFWLD